MRKVRFVGGEFENDYKHDLIYNKIYDVIEYNKGFDAVTIMVIDEKQLWHMHYGYRALFRDVTSEYRNEVIDNILL